METLTFVINPYSLFIVNNCCYLDTTIIERIYCNFPGCYKSNKTTPSHKRQTIGLKVSSRCGDGSVI